MTLRFTPEQEAEIVAEYGRGTYVTVLARRLGCSFTPIERVLRAHGAYEPHKSMVGRKYTEQQRRQMAARYDAGESIHKIAKDYGALPQSVWKILRSLEVAFRDKAWRGGRVKAGTGQKYMAVFIPVEDPLNVMANVTGYVLEHRLVMARSLGRPLEKHETVHHINGDKMDNRLENLQLRQGRHGKGAKFTCLDCGSHNVAATQL